jgi:signal transduction histidine kinase/ActR/RegA family two-component response regulator
MLILPTNNAFERHVLIGMIGLLRQIARGKNPPVRVRVLVSMKNIKNSQGLVQEPFPSKENHEQDTSNNIHIRHIAEQRSVDLQETILIVDRKTSLIIELKDDTKAAFEEAIGLATYSDSKSTVLSYVSIFETLWGQTELYQELKELYKRLQDHDRMQNEFISIAAHELRTPIQPILGLSELLLSRKVNVEQEQELLNVIIRNAKRLRKITENILGTTKIESQQLKVNKQYFGLSDMISSALAENKKLLEGNKQKKIKLAYSSNSDNIVVKADSEMLNQVVSNLLGNAIKFTQSGGISVNVAKDDADQQITVSVTDTGQGIDPEIMPRLFTKFATKSIAGTGLGLYISKKIIEAHGGKMWAENNPGGTGATFSFTIPMAIQQGHRESMVIDTVSTTKNGIGEGGRKGGIYHTTTHKAKTKRIFLVDDDHDHTITFKLGLELAGFEVDAYNDSAVALSKFRPDYYDLLLIDVKMPKIDGLELYERIRKMDNEAVVWFITAYETYYRSLKAVSPTSKGEMGPGPVIEKPIEIDRLVKQIKTELHLR